MTRFFVEFKRGGSDLPPATPGQVSDERVRGEVWVLC